MEINAIEYKMARRSQTRDHQIAELKKLQIQLERQEVIRDGCNNAIRALDHVIFNENNIDDYISSFDGSDAKRPNTELDENTELQVKPPAKRHNNGNSEKWMKKVYVLCKACECIEVSSLCDICCISGIPLS